VAQLALFNTDHLAPEARLDHWGEHVWKVIGNLRTEQVGETPFSGEVSYGHTGALQISRIVASAHRVVRTAGMIAQDDRNLVKLVVQKRGRALFAQGGNEVVLEPGDWSLYDTSRPYEVTNFGDVEQLVILIPRERLLLRSGELAKHTARRFGTSGGAERLVVSYVSSLFDELPRAEEGSAGDLVDMAAQLVRLTLQGARAERQPIPMRETLRMRVEDHVRRNLQDPSLSIEHVAARFGFTKRNLHKIFSDGDLTLGQFIWSQRLDRCQEALSNPALATRSITEIAFMWGFSNSAHFSKSFKERFGVAPGRYRAAALAELASAIH